MLEPNDRRDLYTAEDSACFSRVVVLSLFLVIPLFLEAEDLTHFFIFRTALLLL